MLFVIPNNARTDTNERKRRIERELVGVVS